MQSGSTPISPFGPIRPPSPMTIPTPLKIAFCITDLDPGGAERALVQLVIRLDRSRFSPHVICLAPAGELTETLLAADVPVTCLNTRRRWDVTVVWRLLRELKKVRPELLQTFLFHANIAGRVASWLARVPHVVSGIRVAERRRNSYLLFDRLTEWMVEKHVCVSQAVVDHSRTMGRLNAAKLCVIPNGVDFDRFSTAAPIDLRPWKIEPDDQIWVTVGRLDPQKGPWDLLNTVEKLHAKHPGLKLLWAGRGPLQADMQQWIDTHQLQNTIHLIGWQDNIPGLLRAAKGFVLFSHWEGMPNVVLEALAAGLPVISTNVEGVAEIINDDQTGWIINSGDDFSVRWDAVLRDPQSAAQVAQAGQQRVRDHFSWDAMAQQYMDLYENLSQPKAGKDSR
ncbi:MAG: Lipopolysaccharide core biosynthesis glycosyl transferase lpsD [Planctomycetaceae bacterium]|nr:Lipopolysaccharide core biosynthesis glycosyl transferase lpsD [Planctomycetaceae bacterium]